jgi:hypothetical protein
MYGSCATQLDMPSSDLDVVVCGLDRPVDVTINAPPTPTKTNQAQSTGAGAADEPVSDESIPTESTNNALETHQLPHHPITPPHPRYSPSMYGHLSLNAERVLLLAAELERQPWAVHVKAIPTASVPVIKILADPARLPGAIAPGNGENWLMQQHQMATQQPSGENDEVQGANQQPVPHFHPNQTPPVWRGADVVNGLLQVDITFEGPEHGGIGSTEISARAVQDFCDETGLAPEGTPFVQVLMVLKELLAQRRLNEPFSGGLSSYALLLLLISVLGERGLIREELERVDRQRRMVAAGGGNSVLRGASAESNGPPSPTNKGGAAPVQKKEQPSKATKQPAAAEEKPATAAKPPQPMNQANLMAATANKDTKKSEKAIKKPPAAQASKPPITLSSKATLAQKSSATQSSKSSITQVRKPLTVQAPKPSIDSKAAIGSQGKSAVANANPAANGAPSSWASIAKNKAAPVARKASQDSNQSTASEKKPAQKKQAQMKKVSSFADAVANGTPASAPAPVRPTPPPAPQADKAATKKVEPQTGVTEFPAKKKEFKPQNPPATVEISPPVVEAVVKKVEKGENSDPVSPTKQPFSSASYDSGLGAAGSVFPQGFHDVIEVLCSGEATAGKLLMHFLLFYGQHFDSQSTAIDFSGKHQRDFNGNKLYSHLSPYLQRRTAGSYDHMTGMLTVDPIVVYDPLEGAENNNVARSCFAWSSVRWVFAQSYMTLSSAVERSATPPNQVANGVNGTIDEGKAGGRDTALNGPYSKDESGNLMVDPASSLLELLLSF